MKKNDKLAAIEKRLKDLEEFNAIVFKWMVGNRQFLLRAIKEEAQDATEKNS